MLLRWFHDPGSDEQCQELDFHLWFAALAMRDGDQELPRVIPNWELKDPEQL